MMQADMNVVESQLNGQADYKLYIVEDHENVRRLIVSFLGAMPNCSVIGEAASAKEILNDPRREEADLIITDLSMPEISGIELTHLLIEENPKYLIALLTAYNESSFVTAAFEAGACAYVVKEDPVVIESVINRVLAGERNIIELG